METPNGNASGKPVENENHQNNRACPSTNHDISHIFSQVQMMSDSLAAYSQMNKYRPLRKVKIREKFPSPHSSVQILLPAEDRVLDSYPSDGGENIIASYVVTVNRKGKSPHKSQNFESQEASPSKSNSEERLGSGLGGRFRQQLENLNSSSEEFAGLRKGSSRVRMYEPGSVIPDRMIEVIQRELKTLMKLSPSSALLLASMSDTMFHYKGCSKCRNKIYPAFPWILNRLQKLIKFIVIKRHGTYSWPNDYSYLRLVPNEPIVNEPEQKIGFESENLDSSPDQQKDIVNTNLELPLEKGKVQLGQLEKVDPLVVNDSLPGVQILLDVKPKQTKKRVFCKFVWKFRDNSRGKFPVVHLKEPSDIPVFLVLRHSLESSIPLNEKRVVSLPKLISHKSLLRIQLPAQVSEFILSPTPWGRIGKYKRDKSKVYIGGTALLRQIHFKKKSNIDNKGGNPKQNSNEKKSYAPKNNLMNLSELVLDFLKEGEDKMQTEKVKELEVEVKELKSLMLEVRRNQAELSKVLLKKGVYSRPLVRFTDPEMLQDEDWIVKKIAEIKLHKTKTSSLEVLQKTLGELKRKCNLKNRLIQTLLKGFESNVPKEWWDEIMNLMFGASMEEDLDAEKVGDLVRQTSFFLRNGEQASGTLLPLARLDEKPLKEEPIMKGKMGADIQDYLKILSDLDDKWAKKMDDTLLPVDCQFPIRVFAYPTVVQESLNSSIRKLEYQVSILNVENERLWHEIWDLKNMLKSSVKGLDEKTSHHILEKTFSTKPLKTFGKAINITIQIASDKERQFSEDSGALKVSKLNETSQRRTRRAPKVSPVSKRADDDEYIISKEKLDYEDSIQDRKLAVLATGSKLPLRSERRPSANDFNYLDDLTSPQSIPQYRQDEEKIKALLRERAYGKASSPSVEVMMANPQISEHRLWKDIQPVPSMHVVSEATTNYLAGPSRRRLDADDYLQSPSLTELCEGRSDGMLLTVSKERELHPIPEDDDMDPRSSGMLNETIQFLRGKVRSIHKDVTVLKSKNDRIDKVLNKLVDDIKNNNESFEEIQKALYLNNRK